MAWKAQWESYMSLSRLSEELAEKKVQALTLCFSRETLSIVQNLGLSDANKQDIIAIIAAIKTYIHRWPHKRIRGAQTFSQTHPGTQREF